EPVELATAADAPASSGRQLRSSAGIRRTPARFSPSRTRITPPTWRRTGIHGDSPAAANVAVTPSSVNTEPNPATYASAWRKAVQREGPARRAGKPFAVAEPVRLASATATAVSWPMYAGTSGSTHGLRKLRRPAAIATRIVRLSALIRAGPGSRCRAPVARSHDGRLHEGRSHEAPVEDVVEEPADLARRRGKLEATPVELEDRDRGEEAPLPGGIGRDVPFVEGRDPSPARGTVLEQALDDGARLVAQAAAVAGVQDELGEGSRHRSLHSRGGMAGGPRTRLGGLSARVTKGPDWTSKRLHLMMRAVDGRTCRSPRGV